jgi:hypothetical protein
MNGHKLKLEPQSFTTKVSVKKIDTSNKQKEFQCKMTQIPANTYDASTGHKLQDMSKDAIIVTSWPTGYKNWEYVVLSCVCTLSGLYLADSINLEKSFKPSQQLKSYIEYAKTQE